MWKLFFFWVDYHFFSPKWSTRDQIYPTISSVQSLSHVWLFVTSWTTAHQASLSITNSQSPSKPMPIESVMPSNHLILSHPLLLLPSITASRSFQMSKLFASGGQSIGVSVSPSIFPVNTQDWSPLGWTGWISLQSKGLSKVFSNTMVQKHQFFSAQIFLKLFLFFYSTILYWFCHTLTWIHHRYIWVPNPEPPSSHPPHIMSLGHPSAPAPSILYPILNPD